MQLKCELARKEKALAEAVALLVLRKKLSGCYDRDDWRPRHERLQLTEWIPKAVAGARLRPVCR